MDIVTKSSIFWYFSLLLFLRVYSQSGDGLAPALYVFGDSFVDVGNNNIYNTFIKSDFLPYGVDFPGGTNGRPTNGFNMADFYAQFLGLNVPPGYRLINSTSPNIYQGLNYASSAAGILPRTMKGVSVSIISLGEQVGFFEATIKTILPAHYTTKETIDSHISKSIYLVVMGANDINVAISKDINTVNPQDYTKIIDIFVEALANRLTDMYNLGARKFVVYEVLALGCSPNHVATYKPSGSKCVDFINTIVQSYNAKLSTKLEELRSKLAGSTFVLGKYFDFVKSSVENPSLLGLKEVSNPCCVISQYGTCEAMKPPCSDRNAYAYFDSFHPTEVTYKAFATQCFSGTGSCVPMNIKQLAAM